jgi:hypothetical protein
MRVATIKGDHDTQRLWIEAQMEKIAVKIQVFHHLYW